MLSILPLSIYNSYRHIQLPETKHLRLPFCVNYTQKEDKVAYFLNEEIQN